MNKSILFHEERPPPVAAVTVLLHNEKESFPQDGGKLLASPVRRFPP